ncbi:hypothetical protein S245_047016, partial [Arachis hypogaea]
LQSLLRPSFLLVTIVIILHLSELMRVGKRLKLSKLATSTVGKIFFLLKHLGPLTPFESNSVTCLKILGWLITILRPTVDGVMRSILSEQSSVRVCFLEYHLL